VSERREFALAAPAEGLTAAHRRALLHWWAGLRSGLDRPVVAYAPLWNHDPLAPNVDAGDRDAARVLGEAGLEVRPVEARGSGVSYHKVPMYMGTLW
jgi:hypothetical protein